MIMLTPVQPFRVPVDAGCVTPDAFAGKSLAEIAALPVWEGNRRVRLGDLFKVDGEGAASKDDVAIRLLGDLRKVRRVGAGMSGGSIVVVGDVGNHLGEGLKGGTITVEGCAGLWAGSMMQNGLIEVKGDVGEYTGGAYRGSVKGMKGGVIVVRGNAGNELGCYMRGGLIKVYGCVGQFAGMHMRNGTIFVQGDSAGRVGAEMVKGKIVISGSVPSILPTFTVDGVSRRTRVDGEEAMRPFYTFTGDLAEKGEGKLFISQAKNPHLKSYEKYIG